MRSRTGLQLKRRSFPACALIFLSTLFQSGCITQSLYLARGNVKDADGRDQEAALYWHNSEGRLWYGAAWKGQRENFVTLRYGCGKMSPQFKEEAGTLMLRPSSSGMDRIVAREAGAEVVSSNEIATAAPGVSTCGRVLGHAEVKELSPGTTVALSILCKTCDRANADCGAKTDYPRAGVYLLGPIEVRKKRFFWKRPLSVFEGAPEAPQVRCSTQPL